MGTGSTSTADHGTFHRLFLWERFAENGGVDCVRADSGGSYGGEAAESDAVGLDAARDCRHTGRQ